MRGMPRQPPKHLSPARRDWLRQHIAGELAIWSRITHTMGIEGFDFRDEDYRRACDVHLALMNTAKRHRPRSAGLWSSTAAAAMRASGQLTPDQLDAMGAAAMAAIRDLAPVVDYIDAGGFPCKLLAAAVRSTVEECYGINILLGRGDGSASGGLVPEPPADTDVWAGDGI